MNTYNIWLPLKYTAIRAGSWGWTKVLSWHQPLPCSWLCQPILCAFSPVVYLLFARQVVLQVSNVSISLASLLRKVRFLMTASSWQRTNRLYSSFFWTAKTLGKIVITPKPLIEDCTRWFLPSGVNQPSSECFCTLSTAYSYTPLMSLNWLKINQPLWAKSYYCGHL